MKKITLTEKLRNFEFLALLQQILNFDLRVFMVSLVGGGGVCVNDDFWLVVGGLFPTTCCFLFLQRRVRKKENA